jgi:putative endonuclease
VRRYFLYVLECSDSTLYTGITTDIDRRLREHNTDSKKGSKYTRARRPVRILAAKIYKGRSEASKAESKFKKLSRKEKLEEIKTW